MRRLALATSLAMAAALTACAATGGSTDDAGPTATLRATPDPIEPPSSRCESASAALVSAIETGLTVTGGGSLSNVAIVKSDDFENVHFVAAEITGEGMSNAIGVWATNDPTGGGLIFSANAMAREFSDWGDGPGFSPSDDGMSEAEDCARG